MDTVQDDAITTRSTKHARLNGCRKRKKVEMDNGDSKKAKTNEREKRREQQVKLKGEQLTSADPLGLLQRPPRQTTAKSTKTPSAKQKAKHSDAFLRNEQQRMMELQKRKHEKFIEEQKAKLKKKERERKRRRQMLDEYEDLASFPSWIEEEIDELERDLNVRPRKIKSWQMSEEQLEQKRKYEREKQRRQRAKIKAQKSIYDPLDLLQIGSANYDDDEGRVQHLWRPDVE